MLADEFPGWDVARAKTLGGSPVVLNLYVKDDVDSLFNQAVAAGATVTMPLANQFWGDRYGQVTDPFGHRWALGQHVEDVAPDEMERRAKEAFCQDGGNGTQVVLTRVKSRGPDKTCANPEAVARRLFSSNYFWRNS